MVIFMMIMFLVIWKDSLEMKVFLGNNPTADNKCEISTKYPTYVTKHNSFLKREIENK